MNLHLLSIIQARQDRTAFVPAETIGLSRCAAACKIRKSARGTSLAPACENFVVKSFKRSTSRRRMESGTPGW